MATRETVVIGCLKIASLDNGSIDIAFIAESVTLIYPVCQPLVSSYPFIATQTTVFGIVALDGLVTSSSRPEKYLARRYYDGDGTGSIVQNLREIRHGRK